MFTQGHQESLFNDKLKKHPECVALRRLARELGMKEDAFFQIFRLKDGSQLRIVDVDPHDQARPLIVQNIRTLDLVSYPICAILQIINSNQMF